MPCDLSSSMREKSILLHVIQHLDHEGAHHDCSQIAWYVINQTSDGAEIRQILKDVQPPNHPDSALFRSNCRVVGSSIYVIGGENPTCDTLSNCLRCIDASNPGEGYKTCPPLPFVCADPLAAVYDSWIYVFGGLRGENMGPWGYVFDTRTQRGYGLEQVADGVRPSVFAALDGQGPGPRGLLAYSRKRQSLYLHDPIQDRWETFIENIGDIGYFGAYAVSNGIFYFYNPLNMCLHAYDFVKQSRLPSIDLSNLDFLFPDRPVHLVSVAEGKLCTILVVRACGRLFIYYTKLSVSYDPVPHVDVEDEQVFNIKSCFLLNCEELDPCPDRVTKVSGAMYGGLQQHKKQKKN